MPIGERVHFLNIDTHRGHAQLNTILRVSLKAMRSTLARDVAPPMVQTVRPRPEILSRYG